MEDSVNLLPEILWKMLLGGIVAFSLATVWRIFEKAGEPGWAVLIPIYNVALMIRLAGKPWWWLLLLPIPLVNYAVVILVSISIARNFGRGRWFGLGLGFLSLVFYPILAFGDAEYGEVY